MIGMLSKSTKYENTTFPTMHRRGASSCQRWEKLVQHLLSCEAEPMTEIQHSSATWGGISSTAVSSVSVTLHRDARAGYLTPEAHTAARTPDFILSMRSARRLYGAVATQKNTRWRSSSTEWGSSPTKQWAGKAGSGDTRPRGASESFSGRLSEAAVGTATGLFRSAGWVYTGGVRAGHTCSWMTDGAERGGGPCTDEDGTQEAAADHWRRAASFCWSTEMLKLPSNELY